jgi:hypothetical protein
LVSLVLSEPLDSFGSRKPWKNARVLSIVGAPPNTRARNRPDLALCRGDRSVTVKYG